LIRATEKGHKEVVKFFVESGATINIKDNKGKTALTWAEKKEHKKIVEYLQSVGAK